jgi:UDP-glucuronate 4-epimerase
MTSLVTGVAGFIGFHIARNLLRSGHEVVGIDNVNSYYDINLKLSRISELKKYEKFRFYRFDINDEEKVKYIFETKHQKIVSILHLAAQAGVRYSTIDPYAYVQSNLRAHVVLLEAARSLKSLKHFVYASSSSVYGANDVHPYSVQDRTDHPVSLYGASKKSMELVSESYASMYRLPLTGLRFFTVYGPWGRPDMAMYIFAKRMLASEPIPVFGDGLLRRDFTYIDDIVSGVLSCLACPPDTDDATQHRVFNLGNTHPVTVLELVELLERSIGREAKIDFLPMQKGDVLATHANIDASKEVFGFSPVTDLGDGVVKFVSWYLWYANGLGKHTTERTTK